MGEGSTLWKPDDRSEAPPGLLETHRQTAHKLELMRRYWRLWCRILAQARGNAFCVGSLWLVDGFAGRGLHPANSHPDGAVPGSPIQAFRAAMETRRRYPDVAIYLRAIELNCDRALELERRLVRRNDPAGPEWRVARRSFEDAVPDVIAEMAADDKHGHTSGGYRRHDHRSLWFIDPDGLRDIPHLALEPLMSLPGAEVIVNLDMTGMWRVKGAAQTAVAEGDRRALLRALNENRLDLTFGGDVWRDVFEHASADDILRSVAQGYADTFASFEHRHVYRLHGTVQRRFLVHLTHSEVAANRFASEYDVSWRLGTIVAGEHLDQNQRAYLADRFGRQMHGSVVGVAEMYELGLAPSRRQIEMICRAAQERGWGEYDEQRRLMTWYDERLPDPDFGF